ncbi:hypothetical protein B0O80DRAFT_220531 [Mortierella sp. GBAus27b]|nr:hypothetical protein B0O80DRAFT_220531 [Mortierella sp. GBAus27b]
MVFFFFLLFSFTLPLLIVHIHAKLFLEGFPLKAHLGSDLKQRQLFPVYFFFFSSLSLSLYLSLSLSISLSSFISPSRTVADIREHQPERPMTCLRQKKKTKIEHDMYSCRTHAINQKFDL